MRKATIDRFNVKYEVTAAGCWEWTAHCGADGYGTFWNGERNPPRGDVRGTTVMVLAHRWSYEYFNGPIPNGLKVLHRCDNPPCVNPEHLFVGTQADNIRDCEEKGRRNQVHNHKLADGDRDVIRARYTGAYGQQTELAKEYGVAQAYISSIVGGRAGGRR